MNSQEYLKDQLECLVESFPSIRIRYESDTSNNCHFIDVVPLEIYKHNVNYQQAEDEITLDFITRYPTENIVFISEGGETVLTKVDYEIFGNMFHVNRITAISEDVVQHYILNYSNQLSTVGIFKAFEPVYYNLGSTLLVGTLPVIHPFLTGINYYASSFQYMMNHEDIGILPVTPCLPVESIKDDEQTVLAA